MPANRQPIPHGVVIGGLIVTPFAGIGTGAVINDQRKTPDMFFAYIGNYTKDSIKEKMCKRYYDLEKMPDLKVMVNDAKRFYEDQKELFDYHEKS